VEVILNPNYPMYNYFAILLHCDSSKHCTRPLNKFVYGTEVVTLFLKHYVYVVSYVVDLRSASVVGSHLESTVRAAWNVWRDKI
jgi:hypothetical protein